jgi:hypothetical protein
MIEGWCGGPAFRRWPCPLGLAPPYNSSLVYPLFALVVGVAG